MALSKEIEEDTEFAKSQLMSSDLDAGSKKALLRLLNVSMEATNGISVDEKIQKITETIHGLVISQISFINSIDKKIEKAAADRCATCKAYKHADDVEFEKQKAQIIASWKAANGLTDDKLKDKQEDKEEMSWMSVLKLVITKPAAWIFLSILVISPYGVDIVKAILQFCGK